MNALISYHFYPQCNDSDDANDDDDDANDDDGHANELFVRPSLPVATAGTAFCRQIGRQALEDKAKGRPARDTRSRFLGQRSGGEFAVPLCS